ncbi:Dtr1 protein [Maudiozyma humilis]|uniref:Dtr1 protein n=1 Tax=Maudiozyma humilis TaxID=51915 RepID=A0AAV5S4T3_MAUHU|nr:Dtr1 protein [Kazachstania humilis]
MKPIKTTYSNPGQRVGFSNDSLESVNTPDDEVVPRLSVEEQGGNNSQDEVLQSTLKEFPYNITVDKSSKEETSSPIDEITADNTQLPYSCLTKGQALTIFGIIIFIGFLGPMSGNIYIPALPVLQTAFNVSSTTINGTVSVFMAVFAVGPLFWGAFADVGGRKILYLISLLLMLVVNILLASLPPHISALYILRIAQAFSCSSVISLGAGTVTDITKPSHRGKAIAYFMLGPNMGPIVAPIIAGLILMKSDKWQWLFGFSAIMCYVSFCLVLIVLPETLRCKVGNMDPGWRNFNPKTEDEKSVAQANPRLFPKRTKWRLCPDIGFLKSVSKSDEFKTAYPSPPKFDLRVYWKLLLILPVTFTSIATAILFANYYAFSVTLSHYLHDSYNKSTLQIGACYVCPGIFMILGSQIGGHVSDYLRKVWIKKHGDREYPLELRLNLQIPGILLNTLGCVGYGWSIQKHYHLAVVLVFSALNAFGLTWCSNSSMTYLTELLCHRAAGTVALSSLFRNVAAAISSAVIIKVTNHIGAGWGFTVFGFLNIISVGLNYYIIRYRGSWQHKVGNI